LTLSVMAQMWKDGDILIPDFQREFVWSIEQSSQLIESFLQGLPVPSVFFYVDEQNKNLVIDGQQRILSVIFFLEGLFGKETLGKRQVFRLQGLGKNSPYVDKRFIDLAPDEQRKIKQSVLRAINIKQLGPTGESTCVYHIFERLNTGGTPLKAQEIRNCVFRGDLVGLLRDANEDPKWRALLGKKAFDRHQKDVELVLRLFALYGAWQTYEKPLKEFLNVAMRKHQPGSTKKAAQFFKLFPDVTARLVKELDPKPFHLRGPLNASALDAVMITVLEDPDIAKGKLKDRYEALKREKEFWGLTQLGTTDTATLQNRIKLAKKILGS
jgi:hypothetical protein